MNVEPNSPSPRLSARHTDVPKKSPAKPVKSVARISATHLQVPKRPAEGLTATSIPPAQMREETIFVRLARLVEAVGPSSNKHELAIALIIACIDEGVNTKKGIIGVLYHMGLHRGHVARMLDHDVGVTPESGHWQLSADKTYSGFVDRS